MKPPLKDGTVLITGASSGIGRALAREPAGTAGTLILVARRADRLQELRDELILAHPNLRVDVQPCDLSDFPAVERLVESVLQDVGTVDVLINNAGIGDISLFEFTSWEKIHAMLGVNVTALTYLTRRFLEPMLRQGRGGILNVSSGLGLTFMPALAAYGGTKHFISAFTESLRIELAGTGVVVSQLCPGPVETEFMDVAGNPTGHPIPRIARISAERCAREAVRGFARGRAILIPGFLMRSVIWLGRISPRPVLRVFYSFVGKYLRSKQSASSKESPKAVVVESSRLGS